MLYRKYPWKKQKEFAMLVVRLSDMLWLLQFLSFFHFILMVKGNENGMFEILNYCLFRNKTFDLEG